MLSLLKIIVGVLTTYTPAAFAQIELGDLLRNKPGFAAEIQTDVCNQSFPYHRAISRPLKDGLSFDLFAFTAKEFDPQKPNILFLQGGPGGMWGPKEALEMANKFPDSNAIFFHFRGGGCSGFPNLNSDLDDAISSRSIVDDIEIIRITYKIKSWKAVIGFSYGTSLSRLYAHLYPEKIEKLILEGLSSPLDISDEQATVRILQTIADRYKVSPSLQKAISSEKFASFLSRLKDYLGVFPSNQNFGFAAMWWKYKKIYDDYFSKLGTPFPTYLNRDTFLAVTVLAFSGEVEISDQAIWILLNNFGFIAPTAEQVESVTGVFRSFDKSMFPFLFPDYVDVLKDNQLMSWRVFLAVPENDKALAADSMCSPIDTIVINGTQDLATPVENVKKFLTDKACAKGKNEVLIVRGGGHSSFGTMKCLGQYVNHALDATDVSEDLKSCEFPVAVEKY